MCHPDDERSTPRSGVDREEEGSRQMLQYSLKIASSSASDLWLKSPAASNFVLRITGGPSDAARPQDDTFRNGRDFAISCQW